ncbi:MAG: hypothetical protein WDM77_18145 [Steroidobacteraceae bacterium]
MTGLPIKARRSLETIMGVLAMAGATAPVLVWSQNQAQLLPPVIRSCVAEADAGVRLDCYDREVARLIMPPDRAAGSPAVTPPVVPPALRVCLADADAGRRRDCYDREVARMIMPPDRPASAQQARPPAEVTPPSRPIAAPIAAASEPKHVSAHVTRLESDGDRITVHLDNDQAWQQSTDGSTHLALRSGDAVTIDRQLGSWWLTDRNGETLQVRRVN